MIAVVILMLCGLLALGVHVATVIGVIGVIVSEIYSFAPLTRAAGNIAWQTMTDFILVAIPMYILMGEILLRADIADRMYAALDKWLSVLPGGLIHTNIASSALFSATSGSSVATAATVGTLSVPNIERWGYHPPLYLGSLAAGGTLGILIPPSINLIIYGVLAEVSVTKLYLAALFPGLLLALLFSTIVFVICIFRPTWDGRRGATAPLREKLRALVHLLPPIGLFVLVVGSIYGGFATPTEAASLGVVGALLLAAGNKRLNVAMLRVAFRNTIKTTSMIMLIVVAAYFLNFVLVTTGVIDTITGFMLSLNFSALQMLLVIICVYLLLGAFMETMAMMIATIPVVVPIIVGLGYDPLWFGVVLVILVEAGMITPPYGINLFVIQSVRNKGSIGEVSAGSLPFLAMMMLLIACLIVWPSLALWLPSVALD